LKTVRRSRFREITLALLGALAITAVVAVVVGRQPSSADAAAAPFPTAASYDAALVAQGAWLAAMGNCNTCHTADNGRTFAGGRPLPTPFGTVHATNITPDPETGIGRWSAADFLRAMHEGIDKEGRHLYPAFPYDHFTHVAADDVNAIYAFLMTRDPVTAKTPANRMLVARPAVAVWKALYFKPGSLASDPAHDASWNRGRYLVDGLGHCGACHTPRNALGAEKEQEDLGGGTVEGWQAPALNDASPAPAPWTVDQLVTYLRTGFEETHGSAAGAMAPVADNLSVVPEPEVRAIAVYIAARMGASARATIAGNTAGAGRASGVEQSEHSEDAPVDASQAQDGGAIYRSTCAGCHDGGRRGIALEYSTTVTDRAPTNLIRITLDGIHPREGEKGQLMPGFRGALGDPQLASLVAFLRTRFGHAPPWQDVGGEIAKAKRKDDGENRKPS